MLQNYLTYIALWLLFQLLVEINCQIPFRPKQRSSHTATFLDDKLYILGGLEFSNGNDSDSVIGKEFFYLDVSGPFNTVQELLWKNLSRNSIIPSHYGATTVRGGTSNNTLFLYGGFTYSAEMELVYTFNPPNSWTTPKIAGVNNIRKDFVTGIINHDRKMYLWGGRINGTNANSANDMLILDTISLSWGEGSLVGSPSPRSVYGATLLPDNKIIYMGK
jgi:hypothetical protein